MQAILAIILAKESSIRLSLALILHNIHILHEFCYVLILFLAVFSSVHANHRDRFGWSTVIINLIVDALGRGAPLR